MSDLISRLPINPADYNDSDLVLMYCNMPLTSRLDVFQRQHRNDKQFTCCFLCTEHVCLYNSLIYDKSVWNLSRIRIGADFC